MTDKIKQIREALDILEITTFVSLKEIKQRYHELSKRYHPDIYENDKKMIEINRSYKLIKDYIDNFRFSFDEEEINKQCPKSYHAQRFRF